MSGVGRGPQGAKRGRVDPEHSFGSALSWSYVMTGGRMAVTLLVSLLLAGLLGPTAFGLIAMANVYIFFVDMLVRQGLVAAIIQRPGLTRAHMDTAFWMICGVIAVVIPVSVAASPWWAAVNQTPRLQGVIIGLSPVLALRGLAVVQEAQLRRRLDYRSLALRTNLAVVAGGLVGVGSALLGVGVWALVFQQVTLSTVEVVVLWRVSDWRPAFAFDRASARELIGFSGFSGLAGLGVFLNQKMDALLIGLLFGPASAGLFRLAVRLTDTIMQASGGALQNVSLPELARYTTDRTAFNQRVGEILRLANVLTVPFLAVLAVTSRPLLAVLGPEWEPVASALQVLCVLGVIQVYTNLVGPILQAAGRPGVLAAFAWLAAGLSALAFVIGGIVVRGQSLDTQVGGLALSRLVGYVLILGVLAVILPRILGLRMRTVGAAVARPALASVLGWGVATSLLGLMDPDEAIAPWGSLVVSGVLAATSVGGALFAIDPLARRLAGRLWAARPPMLGGRSRARAGPDASGSEAALETVTPR